MLTTMKLFLFFFFFQAEDGIRDYKVTGVQTCALPISLLLERGQLQILFHKTHIYHALKLFTAGQIQ